jgi:F-type H+/Na+-transporting ATPase subunit alpha
MKTADSILQHIYAQIEDAKVSESFAKQGEILEIKDGVAIVTGLQDVQFSEIVTFENNTPGLVLDLLPDYVGILILGTSDGLMQGQLVKGTGKTFSIGVGEGYLGKVVNALGEVIDGSAKVHADVIYPVERVAPGVMTRQSVDQPLQTGIKSIDTLIPIGRGQRELLIGDRQTGKTTIALDTILNQKGTGIKCIYVAIGQKESKVARFVDILREHGAMDYTIVVNAPVNSPAVLQYLAPYVGCAYGEYFMDRGQDALIIYDDLSKHAVAYREISLLLRRPPGREAYPGDVFYLHSRLLERAARVNADYVEKFTKGKVKGVTWSLTALPIIETQAGDLSAYVPTNVISITDGQIFLDTDLFNSGVRPAVNVGTSVSRVGGSAQTNVVKKSAWSLKLDLASFREMAAFAQFSSDLDKETLKIIERGKRMVEALKQAPNQPIAFEKQAALMYAGGKGFLDKIAVEDVLEFEKKLYEKLDTSYVSFADQVRAEAKMTDEVKETFEKIAQEIIDEMKLQE